MTNTLLIILIIVLIARPIIRFLVGFGKGVSAERNQMIANKVISMVIQEARKNKPFDLSVGKQKIQLKMTKDYAGSVSKRS